MAGPAVTATARPAPTREVRTARKSLRMTVPFAWPPSRWRRLDDNCFDGTPASFLPEILKLWAFGRRRLPRRRLASRSSCGTRSSFLLRDPPPAGPGRLLRDPLAALGHRARILRSLVTSRTASRFPFCQPTPRCDLALDGDFIRWNRPTWPLTTLGAAPLDVSAGPRRPVNEVEAGVAELASWIVARVPESWTTSASARATVPRARLRD